MADAAQALGIPPRRVFLTQGRQQLAAFASAPQHRYLVRAIERPDAIDALPHHRLILSRGPFALAGEEALIREENIEFIRRQEQRGRRDLRQDRGGAELGSARRDDPSTLQAAYRAGGSGSRMSSPGSTLIAPPVSSRRQHHGRASPRGDEACLARTDDDERAHVGDAGVGAFEIGDGRPLRPHAPIARANATGVAPALRRRKRSNASKIGAAAPSMRDCRAR